MKKIILSIILFLATLPSIAYAGRGCCSHHGGVSHCDTTTGKQVCNDGTYSPSCTCERKESNDKEEKHNNNSNSTNKTESIYEQIINSRKEEEQSELEKKIEENIDDILILAGITACSGYLIKKHS